MRRISDTELRGFPYFFKMPSRLMNQIRNKITDVESNSTPLINCIITFIACVFLRDFLEAFINPSKNFFSAEPLSLLITLVHISTFYVSTALLLAIAVHYVTKTPIISI